MIRSGAGPNRRWTSVDGSWTECARSPWSASPAAPDCGDALRKSSDVPTVADDAVAVGAGVFWTQFGLWSPEAARTVLDAGMDLVMDRCLKVEHARFNGGLHLAGFDTGVIDSRRR